MVKYYNYDVVFREIPEETTLALNITNCPNRCPGCHSPHLQQDLGHEVNEEELSSLLSCYGKCITCVCFMGGDATPHEIALLAKSIKRLSPTMKTAWYSGRDTLPEGVDIQAFDYIKLGRWRAECGPLSSPTTNQKLYHITPNEMEGEPNNLEKKIKIRGLILPDFNT